jgi:DNA-binding NtrC family response regulator
MAAPRSGGHVLDMEPIDILLLDDDVDCAVALSELLTMRGHLVRVVHTIDAAYHEIVRGPPAVFVTDFYIIDETADTLLERVAVAAPRVRRIIVSGSPASRWQHLVAQGVAHAALTKPPSLSDLCAAVEGSWPQ